MVSSSNANVFNGADGRQEEGACLCQGEIKSMGMQNNSLNYGLLLLCAVVHGKHGGQ